MNFSWTLQLQSFLHPNPYAKKMNSSVQMADASAPFCVATSSTTVRITALMKWTAIRKVGRVTAAMPRLWGLPRLVCNCENIVLQTPCWMTAATTGQCVATEMKLTVWSTGQALFALANRASSPMGVTDVKVRLFANSAPRWCSMNTLQQLLLICWQIRTSAGSLECVPTSATTPRAHTNAAATSTSPESMTLARLTVSTGLINLFCVLFGPQFWTQPVLEEGVHICNPNLSVVSLYFPSEKTFLKIWFQLYKF